MKIVRTTNYIEAGTIVRITSSADADYTKPGVIIHPASINDKTEIKGNRDAGKGLPIIRTATYYYRPYETDEIEILF